jgi:hypothetical protein
MTAPSLNRPESMTVQMYDAQVIATSGNTPASDTTPTLGPFWSALCVQVAGVVKVDCLGRGGSGGATAVIVPVPAGTTYLACVKVYSGAHGTTATGITGLV